MMLVDIPNETNETSGIDLALQSNFLQNYIAPKSGYNLDRELRQILSRDDISDHDKWRQYNQSLQRFHFLLDEERRKNPYQNIDIFNRAPSLKHHNPLTRHMVPSTNRNYGAYVNNIPRVKHQIDTVQNIKETDFTNRAYNQNIERGQYDFSPRKANEKYDRAIFDNSIDDSRFQSALDIALPLSESSSDNEEEVEENGQQKKVTTKRKSDETPGIRKKQLRKEEKTIYSQGLVPLQRWLLNQKAKSNQNKLRSLLHSIPSTSKQHEYDEIEMMDIEPISRKRRHEMEETVPSKTLRLHSAHPYEQSRRATISMSRLPYPLTEESIKKILKEDKNKVKIKKWESLPRRTTRQSKGREM